MIFVVFKQDANNVTQLLYDNRALEAGNYGGAVYLSATNQFHHNVGRTVAPAYFSANASGANWLSNAVYNIVSVESDTDNATAASRSVMYSNGGNPKANNALTTAATTSSATQPMYIGALNAFAGPNLYFTGNIGELIWVNGIDATTRQKTEGYLAHKWGLTANLPADHPWKNQAPTK
jgi:hypothetical protein